MGKEDRLGDVESPTGTRSRRAGAAIVTDIGRLFPALVRREDGIWYGRSATEISYSAHGHDTCYQVEEDSYWFAQRNNCIAALLEAFPPLNAKTLFDIGGGNGVVSLALLRNGFDVVLVEPGPRGATHARQRGVPDVICSTLEAAGAGPASIANACLFDVLEHVQDDVSFLGRIAAMLKPQGRLYLTVPAMPLLWSAADRQAGHFRRYRRSELVQKLEMAGFSILFSSSFFSLLPLPIFFMRTIPSLLRRSRSSAETTRSYHRRRGGIAGSLMKKVFEIEVSRIRRRVTLPAGTSIIVAAQVR
jgi:SAM-dependent methyltransferase